MKKVDDFSLVHKLGFIIMFFLFSTIRISAYVNDIENYIKAASLGGAIQSANDKILSGSQLNWGFYNNSTENVTLKSLQLIDGQTGQEGNIMNVNEDVGANSSVSYTTTIGALGINMPVTCRFRYEYYGNSYSVDAVYSNNTFPDIPTPTNSCTLTIKAAGGGSVSYKGSSVRNTTNSFDVDRFSSPTISFSPDNGYRIKSVMANNSDVTSSVYNNQYTVNIIMENMTIDVEFEEIPIYTYNLTISISGNGYVDYNGTVLRDASNSFTVNEGSDVTFVFYPDNGYRLKSVKRNDVDVTSRLSNNQFTTSDIIGNTRLDVVFEPIQPTTYTLTITSSGNGSASYDGTTVRGETSSFSVNEGTNATITFTPDNGYRIKSVKVNNSDVTTMVSNNSYNISIISANTTIEVEFENDEDSTISGQCGENVYYSYDKTTHTLTISGEGEMTTELDNSPWLSYLNDIQSVIIKSGVSNIGGCAFRGCVNLTSVSLGNSVTSIASEAFYGCSGLTSITIPESVGSICWRAFAWCGLTSITILGSPWIDEAFGCPLTSVHISDLDKFLRIEYERPWEFNDPLNFAHHLFLNGEEIKDLVIPSTITKINDGALSGASSLTSVTIPNSVTSIGGLAFAGCSSLSSVVSEIENPYVISNTVFDGIPSDAQLIVPKGTKAAYQTTEGWNRFTNIVEAGGTEPELSGQIHINDIYYNVTESGEAEVASADNGATSITISSTISHNNTSYKVTAIAKDAFENCEHLSAVIWEPEAQFNAKVNNPNFLLYVSDEKYASHT